MHPRPVPQHVSYASFASAAILWFHETLNFAVLPGSFTQLVFFTLSGTSGVLTFTYTRHCSTDDPGTPSALLLYSVMKLTWCCNTETVSRSTA